MVLQKISLEKEGYGGKQRKTKIHTEFHSKINRVSIVKLDISMNSLDLVNAQDLLWTWKR